MMMVRQLLQFSNDCRKLCCCRELSRGLAVTTIHPPVISSLPDQPESQRDLLFRFLANSVEKPDVFSAAILALAVATI